MKPDRTIILKDYKETVVQIQAILKEMTQQQNGKQPYVRFVDQIASLDVLSKLGLKLLTIGKAWAEIESKSPEGFEDLGTRLRKVHEAARETLKDDLSLEEMTYRATAVISIVVEIEQAVGASLAYGVYGKTEVVRPEEPQSDKTSAKRNKIFIVHGRDHKPVTELEGILTDLGLNPVVLFDKARGSRTTIERLEKHTNDVGYAFAILTPDDRGGFFKGKSRVLGDNLLENMCFRARQNVILEFGYFIGNLGRDKVCCLRKGEVELPSDMLGIEPIRFEESVHEVKDKIVTELENAGYELKVKKEETERHNEDQDRLRRDVEMLKRRGINPPL
jgi:predicted nucleotide-binding protein